MKSKRQTFALLLVVLSVCTCALAEKQHDWQAGTVRDSQRSRYYAGTIGRGDTRGSVSENGNYEGNTNTSETAVYRVYQDFVIEGDQYAYLAEERLRWRWSKPANLTVNGRVKYAVEKRKLYVIDDDGKEQEMEIIRKMLRTPDAAPK